MNKAEKQAVQFYEKNKKVVASGEIKTVKELSIIARKQDILYKIIHGRADRKIFLKAKDQLETS